jgi:putative RNA 2'-phosphotransferase
MYDRKISKFLSYILRHEPQSIHLNVDEGGWANIDDLIKCANRYSKFSGKVKINRDTIEEIVKNNDKQRFKISDDGQRIRANQGHSFKVSLGLSPVVPPNVLYHGTTTASLDSIMKQGLSPMNRQYVHLSHDRETAIKIGSRHGKPIVLSVDAKNMYDTGYNFYLSDNGVWLTEKVPPEYLVLG